MLFKKLPNSVTMPLKKWPKFHWKSASRDPWGADIENSAKKRSLKLKRLHITEVHIRPFCANSKRNRLTSIPNSLPVSRAEALMEYGKNKTSMEDFIPSGLRILKVCINQCKFTCSEIIKFISLLAFKVDIPNSYWKRDMLIWIILISRMLAIFKSEQSPFLTIFVLHVHWRASIHNNGRYQC